MNKFKLAIFLVLSLILVLLVVQNRASVQAHFLGYTTEMSLVVLLFLTGAIGFVSGLVLGLLLKNRSVHPAGKEQTN